MGGTMTLDIRRLSSGYTHIRGNGPCEWAQVSYWPCGDEELTAGCFPEASNAFRVALFRERDIADLQRSLKTMTMHADMLGTVRAELERESELEGR